MNFIDQLYRLIQPSQYNQPQMMGQQMTTVPGLIQAAPVQESFGLLDYQPTMLSESEEKQFQSWIKNTDWFKEFVKEYGEEPDLNISDYDYRAAWKSGIQPERDPYDKNRFHWPSSLPTGEMLKSATHPTAWKEMFMRETGQNPDALGIRSKEEADSVLRNLRQ